MSSLRDLWSTQHETSREASRAAIARSAVKRTATLAALVLLSAPQVFADDERLAGALLDRLTHHVHILEILGDSYRLKSSLDKDKGK